MGVQDHTFAVRDFKMAEICIARGADARELGRAANFLPDRNVEAVPREEVKAAVCIASLYPKYWKKVKEYWVQVGGVEEW